MRIKRLYHRRGDAYFTERRQWPWWLLVAVYGGILAGGLCLWLGGEG